MKAATDDITDPRATIFHPAASTVNLFNRSQLDAGVFCRLANAAFSPVLPPSLALSPSPSVDLGCLSPRACMLPPQQQHQATGSI